jgi:hypothetical protein
MYEGAFHFLFAFERVFLEGDVARLEEVINSTSDEPIQSPPCSVPPPSETNDLIERYEEPLLHGLLAVTQALIQLLLAKNAGSSVLHLVVFKRADATEFWNPGHDFQDSRFPGPAHPAWSNSRRRI